MTGDRLPLLMLFALGLVVVVVAGLATGSWWVFGIALAVHATASAFVLFNSARTAQSGTEADRRSQDLDERAGAAVGERPRNVETELEALKRQ